MPVALLLIAINCPLALFPLRQTPAPRADKKSEAISFDVAAGSPVGKAAQACPRALAEPRNTLNSRKTYRLLSAYSAYSAVLNPREGFVDAASISPPSREYLGSRVRQLET